jgi:hypothetical protein
LNCISGVGGFSSVYNHPQRIFFPGHQKNLFMGIKRTRGDYFINRENGAQFEIRLNQEPYVIVLHGIDGSVTLYNTTVRFKFHGEHRSGRSSSFAMTIIPDTPGMVSLNFIKLFLNARRMFNAPLFEVVRNGFALWEPLGIAPRLQKDHVRSYFWHSRLHIHEFVFELKDDQPPLLRVTYKASAVIAAFIRETSHTHTRDQHRPELYVTEFSLPQKKEKNFEDDIVKILLKLKTVFLTPDFQDDIVQHVRNIPLFMDGQKIDTFQTVKDLMNCLFETHYQKRVKN